MQEFKIHSWCDVCARKDGARVPSVVSYLVTVDLAGLGRRMNNRQLDLCEPHAGPVAELRELVLAVGTVPSAKVAEAKVAGAKAAGTKAAEAEAGAEVMMPGSDHRSGRVKCPICGRTVTRYKLKLHLVGVHRASARQPQRCPDCKAVYTSAVSMMRHRANQHGYDHVDALVASVKT